MQNPYKLSILITLLFVNFISFAQQYNKSILMEWKGVDNSFYKELRTNSTFKFYSPNGLNPVLQYDEMLAFRRRTNGKLNLDLLIQGDKYVIKHHEKNGYNELLLPESVRLNPSSYEGVTKLLDFNLSSYGKYWDVFKIDMNLNDNPESYQVPLQMRFNMKPNSSNKIEISLKNDGQIVFSANNKGKTDQPLVFYAGDKIDIKNRFQLEFRFSNEGDFVVFVGNRKHFSKQIPPYFFTDGYFNRIWFEGETSIYSMSLEHWTSKEVTPVGLTGDIIYNHNRAVVKHFENLMNKYNIKNQQIVPDQNASSDLWSFNNYNIKPDVLLPKAMDLKKGTFTLKSFKQLAVRSTYSRNSYTLENGEERQYMRYKIHLLVSGVYRTLSNSSEEVTFPLSYSINYPRNFDDSKYSLFLKGITAKPTVVRRSSIKGL